MSEKHYDLVIIGAGPGGYVAAIRAAQLGINVALVEATHLGGICLNWGCIPTKALLKSAEKYQQLQHLNAFGLAAQNCSFDLQQIVSRSINVAEQLTSGVKYLLNKNKIDVIMGNATLLADQRNEKQISVSQSDDHKAKLLLSCQHIIIATGARARQIPAIPFDGEHIWSYRQALRPQNIPARMLVIGSGAIGLEFANFYHSFGAQVTVVEMQSQILPLEDQEIAEIAMNAMAKRGINFVLNATVTEVNPQDDGLVANIQSNQQQTQLIVDKVISAVGVAPNVENLGLETLGIRLAANGFIATDAFGQTSVPNIYAIGDVAGPPCLAHKASHEGLRCVEYIAGLILPDNASHAAIPGCTYSIPQVASIGLTEQAATEQGQKVRVGKFPYSANGKAIASNEQQGLVKVIFAEHSGELLGAHIVGDNATELIQSLAVAMQLETTEEQLMATVFPHPTFSEMIHESVLSAWQRAIHI